VARRVDPRELIWSEGPAQFGFLEAAGFIGPERTDDGIAYEKSGLHLKIWFVGPLEPAVVTSVTHVAADGARCWAQLNCLYVACGCGVLQDVPGGAPNLKTTSKRIHQHATALQRVLPCLLGDDVEVLVRRCQGRQLPSP
jgi:hypothetical protein